MAYQRPSRRNRQQNKYDHATSGHAAGYLPDGESQYTHQASRGHVKMQARPPDLRGKRSLNQQITEQQWKLKNLDAELRIETNPIRRAKILKNIGIKQQFLDRLRGEL